MALPQQITIGFVLPILRELVEPSREEVIAERVAEILEVPVENVQSAVHDTLQCALKYGHVGVANNFYYSVGDALEAIGKRPEIFSCATTSWQIAKTLAREPAEAKKGKKPTAKQSKEKKDDDPQTSRKAAARQASSKDEFSDWYT